MEKVTAITPENPGQRKARQAFSLLEVLMVVAVISMLVATGIFIVGGMKETVAKTKLQSDVATINNAVRTYLVHGGSIPAAATGAEVIARLKSTASSKHLAGLRSSMLDLRLRGIVATAADKDRDRAVWNPAKQRFEIRPAGNGYSAFELSSDPVTAGTLQPGGTPPVRDGSDGGADRPDVREEVAQPEPPKPAVMTKLAAPDVSNPGTLYDISAFNPFLKISLIDPNPPGTAQLFYAIDNGQWLEYTGRLLPIPANLTTKVRTYAAAVNKGLYEDSDQRTEIYETICFTGRSTGVFHSPTGESRVLTNLTEGLKLPQFKWGRPAAGGRQNQLEFNGDSFTRVAPDQEFKLGTLTYYNGTTAPGTNATEVQLGVNLEMTTPSVTEALDFTFKIVSTGKRGADGDYVSIPEVRTNFRTMIKGKQFALVLRFGEHDANGFTTIDTFHAHEGKTLSGTIYGRLTEVR